MTDCLILESGVDLVERNFSVPCNHLHGIRHSTRETTAATPVDKTNQPMRRHVIFINTLWSTERSRHAVIIPYLNADP